MKKGRAGTSTHYYKRHGATPLFAALDFLEGKVIGQLYEASLLTSSAQKRWAARPRFSLHNARTNEFMMFAVEKQERILKGRKHSIDLCPSSRRFGRM
jgi:hypothetical protein